MEYRQLGQWGVRVSSLGLGSYLTIGYTCDDETSRDMVRTAYEAGINYFDTANAYNRGQAEEALGKHLADLPRSDLFVLTKVWAPMGEGPNDRGLSAKHIREQCEASLSRLGMDYVDAYMCHRPDPTTPLEETIRAMEDLARAGKILYWGISEWPAPMIVRANALARLQTDRLTIDATKANELLAAERDLGINTALAEAAAARARADVALELALAELFTSHPELLQLRIAEANASALGETDKIIFTAEGMAPTLVLPGPGIVPTVETGPSAVLEAD